MCAAHQPLTKIPLCRLPHVCCRPLCVVACYAAGTTTRASTRRRRSGWLSTCAASLPAARPAAALVRTSWPPRTTSATSTLWMAAWPSARACALCSPMARASSSACPARALLAQLSGAQPWVIGYPWVWTGVPTDALHVLLPCCIVFSAMARLSCVLPGVLLRLQELVLKPRRQLCWHGSCVSCAEARLECCTTATC